MIEDKADILQTELRKRRKDGKSLHVEKEKCNAASADRNGTVEGIKAKLLSHQVEGLKWMIDRELGSGKNGRAPRGQSWQIPLYSATEADQKIC